MNKDMTKDSELVKAHLKTGVVKLVNGKYKLVQAKVKNVSRRTHISLLRVGVENE